MGTWLDPYPLYFSRASGARIWDVDGRSLVDFASPVSVIHGHAHPVVVDAIRDQVEKGIAWLGANAQQVELAELLRERLPSLERLRFTSSGNEATMLMVRVARAFTGRDIVLKLGSAAHGFYDGLDSELLESGEVGSRSAGVPASSAENVLVGRFNDVEGVVGLIDQHAQRLAGVIMSPVASSEAADGFEVASETFVQRVREATSELEVPLLFDEVVTFRLGSAGAQGLYGVRPDMTALGKLIGGGMAVGAVGGREEIMAVTSPDGRSAETAGDDPATRASRWVNHSGSFNGNPAAMAAGIATLELLTPERYEHLEALGEALRSGLRSLFVEMSLPLVVQGRGSLVGVGVDRESLAGLPPQQLARLLNAIRLAFRTCGVLGFQHFAPSTVMSQADIDEGLSGARSALQDLGREMNAAERKH
jgi:glutamate-1-semialdehyde 2,1-aminomutase